MTLEPNLTSRSCCPSLAILGERWVEILAVRREVVVGEATTATVWV